MALNSAPTEGVRVLPLSQLKSTFPVFKNPANRHKAVASRTSTGSTRSPTPSATRSPAALYERYHVPASGRILWGSVLANFHPATRTSWVDYKNDDRAPLLFVSGSEDHLMPPSVQRSNAKHYKANTVTEIKEYEGLAPAPARRRAGRRSPTTPSTGR